MNTMFEPEERSTGSEWARLLIIFFVLVALVAVPAWLWKRHEANRPALAEIRVVSATSNDPVFREGPRTVAADERVQLAVALRLTYRDGSSKWLAAVEELEIDGRTTEHVITTRWPEEDREARVFWFTLEAPVLGGRAGPDDISEKLAYRSFLAQELGNHWLVDGDPEHHADDLVNLGGGAVTVNAGTYRPYVRVEVSGRSKDAERQAATSLGPEQVDNPRMVRISRQLPHEIGLNPVAGELFRLPGLEPIEGFDEDLTELARQRLATSSWTFASYAVFGEETSSPSNLQRLWSGRWNGKRMAPGSNPPRWDGGVRTGDLLRQGERWLVLVSDDGNGTLSARDLVMYSWGRPPALMPLAAALTDRTEIVTVLRRP
jgi:hypothetical protein